MPKAGLLHDLSNGRDARPLTPRRPPERLRDVVELDASGRLVVRKYHTVAGPHRLALVCRDGLDGTWRLERIYD